MSRICKLRADVKREFSNLGENYLAGEGRHLDSRSFDFASPFAKATEGRQDRFRGNDNWWGKPHPTNLDSRSFDSFDKTPTFAEASAFVKTMADKSEGKQDRFRAGQAFWISDSDFGIMFLNRRCSYWFVVITAPLQSRLCI